MHNKYASITAKKKKEIKKRFRILQIKLTNQGIEKIENSRGKIEIE